MFEIGKIYVEHNSLGQTWFVKPRRVSAVGYHCQAWAPSLAAHSMWETTVAEQHRDCFCLVTQLDAALTGLTLEQLEQKFTEQQSLHPWRPWVALTLP